MEKETLRLEAFSDGVFAIAITLLIIEIKVPHVPHGFDDTKKQLLLALLNLWPSFLAFFLSFGTILVMWVNHHGLFKHAHAANNRLLFANGLLLLLVTFIPFPTAVLAEYLDRHGATVGATFYCATMVLVCIGFNLTLWTICVNRAQAGHPEISPTLRRLRLAYRLALLAYLTATALSLVTP